MKAENKFLGQSPEFWANVKLISQKVGYTQRKKAKAKAENNDVDPFDKDVDEGEEIDDEIVEEASESTIKIPTFDEIKLAYEKLNLDCSKIINKDGPTEFGKLLIEYFEFRAKVLLEFVKPRLMNVDSAKDLFNKMKKELRPKCPLPMNKQKRKESSCLFYRNYKYAY